ncbi:MAG TPA: DUF1549 and DUF1553 domain-containing protein [Gemmataceae bacterium]|jgi:hypothetical protein|nr:DUF1549 and DUF1553 domain-containing protein [Gemmataceae bacterium]
MNMRRILAASVLGVGALVLAAQAPTDVAAQDAKAERKALKLKMLAEKKAAEEKKPVAAPDAKQAPTNIKPPEAPAHPMATVALAQLIDRQVGLKLESSQVKPSPTTTDAEFLRRVYLDLTGVIPTAEQSAAFLDDKSPDKRSKLIDSLLSNPNFGRRMADIWATLMYPVDSDNRFVSKAPLHEWLQEKFNANMHWDAMAFELITATGDADKNGATIYAMSNRGVDKMTDSVGKLFLGVQIQCAQCHNHPFTHWKQAEYWGLAQFFYKVNVSNPRAAKDGGTISVSEEGRPNRKVNAVPESAKEVAPKLLGADTLKLDNSKPYRPVLANWICSPSNPFFAKAFVNRLWAQYMGRGLVNPVDDLSVENEPTHPELLKALAKEFGDSGFDIKHVIRGLCNSATYQRSSKPVGDNRDDRTLYSHQAIKVLSGEQLYDSLTSVLGAMGRDAAVRAKAAGPKGGPVGPREQFAAFFLGSENAPATAYEAGIPQALRLMNNPMMAAARLTAVATKAGEVTKGVAQDKAIEKIYLTALSRRPTGDETKKMIEFAGKQQDQRAAYGDMLWVLLNSSEFALNR